MSRRFENIKDLGKKIELHKSDDNHCAFDCSSKLILLSQSNFTDLSSSFSLLASDREVFHELRDILMKYDKLL